MSGFPSILGIITARGGSKGLPRKNVLPFVGKPLIFWTIEAAHQARTLERVILSTDDPEIMDVAVKAGCEVPFVRPAALAEDESDHFAVLVHAIEKLEQSFDYVVLLQPTSPLRSAEDIDRCIEFCLKEKAPAGISVCESEVSPYLTYRLDPDSRMSHILSESAPDLRRQSMPKTYHPNGAVYVANTRWFLKHRMFITDETVAYLMPRERSFDIDTELDFRIAEYVARSLWNE